MSDKERIKQLEQDLIKAETERDILKDVLKSQGEKTTYIPYPYTPYLPPYTPYYPPYQYGPYWTTVTVGDTTSLNTCSSDTYVLN